MWVSRGPDFPVVGGLTGMIENPSLLGRLADQVGSEELALSILVSRGHAYPSGTLTAEGLRRQAMGAEGRARDRAGSPGVYDPVTNRVTPLKSLSKLRGIPPLSFRR